MSKEDFSITPVRPESTAAIIARRLRDYISQGNFAPGEQLFEVNLAKRFGVSRGVLREALQRLTQEGLLVGLPNRGVFVAEFGPHEVFDIYTARLAIERAACLKVIDVLGTEMDLADKLDSLTDRLEERASERASYEEIVDLDIAFHEQMVDAADSVRLSRMHATLAAESRMSVFTVERETGYSIESRLSEHRSIAAAIRHSEVALLHRLLAEHMDHSIFTIVTDVNS